MKLKYPFNNEELEITLIVSSNIVDIPVIPSHINLLQFDHRKEVLYNSSNNKTNLSAIKSCGGELFILLENNVNVIFEHLVGSLPNNIFNNFKLVYCSSDNIKTKISLILKSQTHNEKGIFRSGIANHEELAYISSGNDAGISLASVNSNKNIGILESCITSVNLLKTRLFVDNGLIKLLNSASGETLDAEWVFDQFDIISQHVDKHSQNQLYFVIPDCVSSYKEAKSIIAGYRSRIMRLLNSGCRMILPLHKKNASDDQDIGDHARDCAMILADHKNLVAGIPCLKTPANKNGKPAIDLRLSLTDIESILSTNAYNHVHFLGMSDVSGKHMPVRMMLARIYNVETTLDASRSTAIFSNNSCGKQIAEEVDNAFKTRRAYNEVTDHEVKNSDFYKNFDFSKDKYDKRFSGLVTQNFYDLIEQDIFQFWSIWNRIMEKYLHFDHQDMSECEMQEMAWQMVGSFAGMEITIFNALKNYYLDVFKPHCKITKGLKSREKRHIAIEQIFHTEQAAFQYDLFLS